MFTPLKEKSRRAMLIEMVEATAPGDILTYGQLGVLFDLDDRRDIQVAVNAAKRSVERNTKKALEAVRNEGYRVAHPHEHHRLAVVHQRKGRGQLKRAMSKVDHVDMSKLTPDQRTVIISSRVVLAAQADFERRADLKYAKREELEEYTRQVNQRSERSENEIQKMKERLSRLEAQRKEQ